MKTFLSVDIDYWNNYGNTASDEDARKGAMVDYLTELTIKAKEKTIPISAVMNHQQMLRVVNQSEARRIINLDTHSDFVDNRVEELNCGTWFAYVNWRQRGEYLWVHGNVSEDGECNGNYPIFEDDKKTNRYSDWGSYEHSRAPIPPSVNEVLADCCDVCVCSSPAYSMSGLVPLFHDWRKLFGIPYKRGLAMENHGRSMTPPGVKDYLGPEKTATRWFTRRR